MYINTDVKVMAKYLVTMYLLTQWLKH